MRNNEDSGAASDPLRATVLLSSQGAFARVLVSTLGPSAVTPLRFHSFCRSSSEYGNADFSFFAPCLFFFSPGDILSQLRLRPDELRPGCDQDGS